MRMNEKKLLRIGLIGFGSMGRTHAYAIRNLPFFYGDLPFAAEIRGVCTAHPESAERAAREFGIPRVFQSENDLIDDPEIDVIDICTPNRFHADALCRAIASGKHVLCEKPLCTSLEEARRILSIPTGERQVTGMVFNNRHLAPILRAKQLIEEGRLGRVLTFRGAYLHNSAADPSRKAGWKQDKTICGGGVLFDLGSHLIDLFSWLCGEFQAVSGLSQIAFPTRLGTDGSLWRTNADEGFSMLAVTKSGAHGTLEVGKLQVGTNDDLSLEIYGELGSLRFSLMDPNHLFFYDATSPADPIGGERGYTAIECVGRYPEMCFPSPKAPAGWLYGHLQSMYAFLSCVNKGSAFYPSLSDGAYVQSVMDAAYRSAEEESRLTEVVPC